MKNHQFQLSQAQRLTVSLFYLGILGIILSFITGGLYRFLFVTNLDSRIIFFTGALLLILGNYIVEPYFTKPADSLVNSLAVIIALLGLQDRSLFVGYFPLIILAMIVLLLTIMAIMFKGSRFGKVVFQVISFLGRAKVIFSITYVLSVYSYIDNTRDFVVLLLFWVMVTFYDVMGFLFSKLSSLLSLVKAPDSIGVVLGFDNPLLYTVEISDKSLGLRYGDVLAIGKSNGSLHVGVVTKLKQLMSKDWISIFLLTSDGGEPIEIGVEITKFKGVEDNVYRVDLNNRSVSDIVNQNEVVKNIDRFLGFVSVGSDINTVNFVITRADYDITEGDIINLDVAGEKTLYQVINGFTNKETLEQYCNHGFLSGLARKLGIYNEDRMELLVRKWVPQMYTPVFAYAKEDIPEQVLMEIARKGVGRLPGTRFPVPVFDYDSLVTHNTAILGILGIGKSCLAFELISGAVRKGIKVICIDITNQYGNADRGLPTYIDQDLMMNDIPEDGIAQLRRSKRNSGDHDKPSEWGNVSEYKGILRQVISQFYESEELVLLLNPDWHPVSSAATKFRVTEHHDLTAAEKTRLISEAVFLEVMSQGESLNAKIWLVYEEAHSLIPEWNSVAYEGDKAATNGTAKVILQGRKYGLGCLAITQRTANISKSVLNQCNTVFALRVFDDTGKQFLENYIGRDYSSLLATLEERHAVCIGKALKLKQPVIIQLNDMRHCQEALNFSMAQTASTSD